MGILAFLCALRGVSARELYWWQRVCLTAMLERERISFSKWHHIYQFLHNWSQLWLAETPEVCHPLDLLRLSNNTSGAFTVPALYPTASCTPGCLKEQHRPNPSCFFFNFLRSLHIHMTDHGKEGRLCPGAPCNWVSNENESPESPNLSLSPWSVSHFSQLIAPGQSPQLNKAWQRFHGSDGPCIVSRITTQIPCVFYFPSFC